MVAIASSNSPLVGLPEVFLVPCFTAAEWVQKSVASAWLLLRPFDLERADSRDHEADFK